MNSDIAIKVENLTKIYHLYDKPQDRLKEALHPFKKSYHHDFYAMDDVSFEVKKGETVGIIGKNGAGKSTLLKMITGVLTQTSGNITINGKIASILELGAGFNPEMSGLENIYLYGTLMGFTRDEMDAKVDAIIAFANIGDFIHQPIKMYSSGMMARLGFSVSINAEPDILIVDEALAVGDMNFQAKCMTAMDKIRQKGTTILFVSHDIGSVKSLCSRGIYIQNGKLLTVGDASEVADLYMQEARETMNQEHQQFSDVIDKDSILISPKKSSKNEFKISKAFEERVNIFRYGSGEAHITCVELLNTKKESIIEVDFNETVTIRIYVTTTDVRELSVNYHIVDDKKIMLLGSNPLLSDSKFISTHADGKYIIEYETQIPLVEGHYSLYLELTSPQIHDQSATFLDVVNDAVVFKVNRRKPARLWSKMYISSKYSVVNV